MPPLAMQRLSCTLRFDTPAFLGDAEQNGVWRTPPFKALLRQWWRVWAARGCSYDVDKLRRREHELFGGVFGASNEKGHSSRVRLRLTQWRNGVTEALPKTKRIGKPPADPLVYLGYGPVNTEKNADGKGRHDVIRPYLPVDAPANTLQLIAPSADMCELFDVVQFIQWFGTLGSRARNGWGSLHLELDPVAAMPTLLDAHALNQRNPLLHAHALPYRTALHCDWPHAFGLDDQKRLLIWRTQSHNAWAEAMRELAIAKQAFRKAVPAARRGFGRRHLLAYPVTKQVVEAWQANHSRGWDEARFANQLRFKVHRLDGHFVGYAFHLPCRLPPSLYERLDPDDRRIVDDNEADDWGKVHTALDSVMQRID